MRIAGNRPLIERVERQCDQAQVVKESCQQIVALQIHRVPEKEEPADTTSSVDLEQVTLRDLFHLAQIHLPQSLDVDEMRLVECFPAQEVLDVARRVLEPWGRTRR
jgi:hypothetical protein